MHQNNGTQETTKPQGYINLHRKIREHWLWEDPVKFQWWVDILMECNYAGRKVPIGGKMIECKRGESLNSLKTWAKRWRVDTGKTRRFLKLLQDDGMITLENVIKTTRLTVCNYDAYNNPQHANDRKTTGKQHANDTQTNTNKKDKKDKKGESTPDSTTYGSSTSTSKAPELDEVRLVFYQNGGTDEMAEIFFNKHSATGWRLNGGPILDFRYLVSNFIKNYQALEKKEGGYASAVLTFNKEDKNSWT